MNLMMGVAPAPEMSLLNNSPENALLPCNIHLKQSYCLE